MLSCPKVGTRVQLWYAAKWRGVAIHHGKTGTVTIAREGRRGSVNEAQITALLFQRHKRDFCLSQCKTGVATERTERQKEIATLPLSHKALNSKVKQCAACTAFDPARIDVWAVRREPDMFINHIAYEIKSSRSDLFRDRKFPSYWPFCNEFYFAVANGLLTRAEMERFAPQCGFIQVTANGARMQIIRRPVRMNLGGIEQSIYDHVLIREREELLRERRLLDSVRYSWHRVGDQIVDTATRQVRAWIRDVRKTTSGGLIECAVFETKAGVAAKIQGDTLYLHYGIHERMVKELELVSDKGAVIQEFEGLSVEIMQN